MSNPFAGWTKEQVEQFNARVTKASMKGGGEKCDAIAVKPIPDTQVSHSLVQSTAIRTSKNGARASEEPNTRTFTIHTDPVAAPRMTRRDKWLKPRRPCVERYFIYRDVLQGMVGDIPIVPDEVNAVFHFSMPESWSKKRRQEMDGKPHRQRPDGDNCTKAIQDALFLEDGGVWRGAFEKRWAIHGRVELTMVWR